MNIEEKQKNTRKRVICTALAAALAVSAFASMGTIALATDDEPEATVDYELVDNIQDGTILHCFDWKYTDIKDELENIAKAGFSSVQTSPAQASEGEGAWYWLYQPLGFSIGTNELGTKEELQELCAAADEYGIKVIVDVVANHLADNHERIQEDLKPDEYWHTYGTVTNWNDREQVTQGDIGMVDLNSENEYVQKVVANYVKELKEAGVDGIRWDAAKHIGLPSEGCNFWPAVTGEGLYNYGEILTGPTNTGSEDLMVEYTKYLSVTDSTYADSLLSAFNKGKAPTSTGNWVNRGVAADKLVYWGESHDTYSNGEGKDSNAVSQNVVDRAYAVAAAQNGASALYFSRPEAKAKDSIRIGVKGSMHFTSDEIAAVNHFHNAMNGLESYYTTTDNNAVVTRKNGGAVIVCGSGSGTVTVENGGGYAKPGTYKDEITGNEFVVTETTITGTVGESGIAVVYDSSFNSRVSASVLTDTHFTGDSLEVTLNAKDIVSAEYEVKGAENTSVGSFVDGDKITIGDGEEAGTVITLTLYGTDSDGKIVKSTYQYYKDASREIPDVANGSIVFDNAATGWDTINIYVYDESGDVTITNGEWPGVEMVDEGDGYYSYKLPEQFAECSHIMVIFNNGAGDQIPGAMQAGLTMAYTDKKLYDGTKWVDLPKDEEPTDEPSEPSEVSDNSEVSGSSNVSQVSQDSSNANSSTSSDSSKASVVSTVSLASVASTASVTTSSTTSTAAVVSTETTTVGTSDNTPFMAAMIAVAAAVSGAVVFVNSKKKREQ